MLPKNVSICHAYLTFVCCVLLIYPWQLPVSVYESLIEVVEAQSKVLFASVEYTLATEDAERVGVDHIARASVTGASERSAGNSWYVCLLLIFVHKAV